MVNRFNPLVSIVIPVYNGSNYMRQAIDSALAQTYKNTEVIVVNDGSRDEGKTDAIAKDYGDRIRYFIKENGGCASALNYGISVMRGEYFSWLSHDDVYLPEKIEHQVSVLSSLSDKATILYGGFEIINAETKRIGRVRPDAMLPADKLNVSLLALMRGLIHGCALLIPIRYFREIGGFNESLATTQDYALWFDIFRVAPLHFDPRILIKSRVHAEQGTHTVENHVGECNQLWMGFLNRIRADEMVAMEGSPYMFFIKTAEFLASTHYREAEQLAVASASMVLCKTKISVVIPFHNRIAWTIEAIRSVQAQTHQFYEILLVDDGTTDDLQQLHELVQFDSRINYIRIENAGGPAKARNVAIAEATGDYIAFLDSDGLFYPEKLELQLKYMEANGYVVSHTSYERIDVAGRFIGRFASGKFSGVVFPKIIETCPIAAPTVMVRTDALRRHLIPEGFNIGEDVCLWIRLTHEFALGGLDRSLSKVRILSSMRSAENHKTIQELLNIACYVANDPVFSQYGKQLRSLLKSIWAVVPNMKGPCIRVTGAKKNEPSLMVRAIKYYCEYGFRETLRQILFVVSR